MRPTEVEAEKYRLMWQCEDYAAHSPGVTHLERFLSWAGPDRGYRTLLDAGSGDGSAAARLEEAGFEVTCMDLVAEAPAMAGSLWRAPDYEDRWWQYGYCCDVLEHLPTEFTMLAARELMGHCARVFFSISTTPDAFGVRIGQPLHLTVQSFSWWRDRLSDIGVSRLVHGVDLGNTAIFYFEREKPTWH